MARAMTVDETIKYENDFCNVTEWHANGITGKGVNVWNCEDKSNHGQTSARRIRDAAPNANIYWGSINAIQNQGKVLEVNITDSNDVKYSPEEWIQTYNIKVASRSMARAFAGKDEGEWRELWEGLWKKYRLVICDSAGNEADKERNKPEGYDIAITVGAVYDNLKPTSYTSVTDDVDFADFTGVWSGTSFSCPYLAGKAALLIERYGDMSQTEIFNYFKMCAKDLSVEGEDNRTGWGIVVLPKFNKKYITMTTKSNTYYIDGKAYEMDTKPVNKNGNVLVPLRVISEALGATVDWQFNPDKTIKVFITKGNTKIELNTMSNAVIINGQVKFLNVEPYIDENNRTLVPIRFIAEGLDCMVDWVQKDAKVMILEK